MNATNYPIEAKTTIGPGVEKKIMHKSKRNEMKYRKKFPVGRNVCISFKSAYRCLEMNIEINSIETEASDLRYEIIKS